MGWISSVMLLTALSHAQSNPGAAPTDAQSARYTSQAILFAQQIDALKLTGSPEHYKVYLVLRSQDVPVEQRKTLAIRILTGDYPKRVDPAVDGWGSLWYGALVALSHLHIDDASLLPFLEENLPKWERIANAYSEEELPEDLRPLKERIYPSPVYTRAVIARLKAVRAVPEVKSAEDLERRLDVMLKEVGMTRQELQQLCEEVKEKLYRTRGIGISERGWLAYTVMEEHRRTLFHYAKRGMDVMPAAKCPCAVFSTQRATTRVAPTEARRHQPCRGRSCACPIRMLQSYRKDAYQLRHRGACGRRAFGQRGIEPATTDRRYPQEPHL
jgi:hypothetical protein